MIYFNRMMMGCSTYAHVILQLKQWCSSEEKKDCILNVWPNMYLSQAMSTSPSLSEVAVFRELAAKFISLQKQLDDLYQLGSLVRDRLLTDTDIPVIKSTLRDRMPRTSQQAVNLIYNLLSDKERSAGSSYACVIDPNDDDDDSGYEENYSLRNTYGSAAQRQTKRSWIKLHPGNCE